MPKIVQLKHLYKEKNIKNEKIKIYTSYNFFIMYTYNKKKMKLTKAQQKALLAQHSSKLAGKGLNPAGDGLNPAGDGLKLAGRGKKLVKGSLEAKARMSVLRSMRNQK